MKGKSINGKSIEEVKSGLKASMTDGFKPTLAFVFLSTNQDWKTICHILDKEGITIFGATTAGEFTDSGVFDGASAILLLDMDPAYFTLAFEDIGTKSVSETAEIMGEVGIQAFTNPAFIISGSHLETPGEAILQGLVEVVGEEATIIGGMAGEATLNQGEAATFTNNQYSRRGLMALILDHDKIDLQGLAVSGWKPVGTMKTVTASEGNWIISIDDQPALDVLSKFMGVKIDLDNEADVFQQIAQHFPLQVQQDVGGPIMKPPLLFNRDTKAVMLSGSAPTNSKIYFSLPPDFDIIEKVIESAENVKSTTFPNADALVIFSCVGRLATLGPLINQEIKGIQDIWNVPMAGFFTFGEFGSVKGGAPKFHGTTVSWVALKEK